MPSEMNLVKVLDVASLPLGTGTVVKARGRQLALFHIDTGFYAIDNLCPHRDGPLGEGDVEGHVVRCPWHAWGWDICTGASTNNPAVKVQSFPVQVRDGSLYVEVEA